MSWEHSVTHVSGLDNEKIGAGRGIRTPDLLITNQLLCQLSYSGTCADGWPDNTVN